MSICRLSDEVRAKIRSGITICSVCGCVRELVYNSVDAGATQVIVKVDITKHFVQVIDNGCGINHEDMIMLGGQSFTSKWYNSKDLDPISSMGFRGEALFSICQLTGTVEVCSRHQLSSETWCKLFHHGRDLGVIQSTSHRKSVGTTVTLRDMFFSMPVRQKFIKESLELEYIRQMIQQTALVNPHISFVVENGTTGMSIVKCKKVQSTLERISQFYGHSIAKNMRPVEHKVGSCYVSGYLSTELSCNKSVQLVYVNRRLVYQNKIHTLLDNLLIHQACTKTRLYPQYLITIQCSPANCDIYYQPSKTFVEFVDWSTVLRATTAAVGNVISTAMMYSDCLAEGGSREDDTTTISKDGVVSHEATSIHFSRGMQSERVQKTAAAATLTCDTQCGISNSSHLDTTYKFIGVKSVSRSPLHASSIAQKLAQFSNERKLTPVDTSNFKPPKYPISDVSISPFVPLDHSTPLQIPHSDDINTAPSNNTKHTMSQMMLQYHTSSSNTSQCEKSKPLLAAPHLSHDTTPFVSGKRMSLSLNSGTKSLSHSNSVDKLLSEWSNPVFKTGQEVMLVGVVQ